MDIKKIIKSLEDIRGLVSLIIFNLEDEIELKDYHNLILLLYKVIELELEIKLEGEKV